MEAESIQCCVTSPPYWGLRDYNIGTVVWGGDEDCEHKWGDEFTVKQTGGGWAVPKENSNYQHDIGKKSFQLGERSQGSFCLRCDAWRGSLGLEPIPDLYVEHLLQIFSEVKRVLKNNGVCWLNLGDSYAGSGGPGTWTDRKKPGLKKFNNPNRNISIGLKPKDLIGIPWRVALALQVDGWYLRSDIIWHKPNPMPESVTDRPTKAHEYIFLLTKSAKYYYDADAIKESSITNENRPDGIVRDRIYNYDSKQKILRSQRNSFKRDNSSRPDELTPNCKLNSHRHDRKEDTWNTNYRNKRSVWTFPTKPYKEAHFATFPPELPRICILAGSKSGDTILDPFGGAMTTLMVAQQLNRKAVGIELNEDYIKIGQKRLQQEYLPFEL